MGDNGDGGRKDGEGGGGGGKSGGQGGGPKGGGGGNSSSKGSGGGGDSGMISRSYNNLLRAMNNKGFECLDGTIKNGISDGITSVTIKQWSGQMTNLATPEIPTDNMGTFIHERLPTMNTGPAAAIVYHIPTGNKGGVAPFDWMFSFLGGLGGSNKVYTEFREADSFPPWGDEDGWNQIYDMLTQARNESHAEWGTKFNAKVTIDDGAPNATLRAHLNANK